MNKDKNWLKEEINKVTSRVYGADFNTMKETDDLIDQLDEPEKVVIPQFVAEHIEKSKKNGKRLNVALSESPEIKMSEMMNVSIFTANNIYAKAWIDGYVVEKDKKYFVLDKDSNVLIRKVLGKITRVHSDCKVADYPLWNKHNLRLTEKEIKDYDERYWTFAKEVTE